MAPQQTARLCTDFHVPGQYVLIEGIDDDGSTYSFPRWFPGVEHVRGEWFNVHRIGKACGIHGIGDGIEVAMCYRELKPVTDDMIGEAEIVAIPTAFLSFTPPPKAPCGRSNEGDDRVRST
jgi:hypothetical protein